MESAVAAYMSDRPRFNVAVLAKRLRIPMRKMMVGSLINFVR